MLSVERDSCGVLCWNATSPVDTITTSAVKPMLGTSWIQSNVNFTTTTPFLYMMTGSTASGTTELYLNNTLRGSWTFSKNQLGNYVFLFHNNASPSWLYGTVCEVAMYQIKLDATARNATYVRTDDGEFLHLSVSEYLKQKWGLP